MIKNCIVCNSFFNRPGKQALIAKYCSIKCHGIGQTGKNNPMFGKPTYGHLGYRLSSESKEKISISMRGRKHSDEHNLKVLLNTPRGSKSPHWTGGYVSKRSSAYINWAKAVKKRDAYTCQHCFCKDKIMHADHIKPYSRYPEIRFELSNGRTLCVPCHVKTDTYGRKGKRIAIISTT